MDASSAEAAAHAHAQAIVKGDYGAMIGAMTPDALGQAMEIGSNTWNCSSYELTPQGPHGDAFVFDITYQTDRQTLHMRERFRQIDGEWKLSDIELAR